MKKIRRIFITITKLLLILPQEFIGYVHGQKDNQGLKIFYCSQ